LKRSQRGQVILHLDMESIAGGPNTESNSLQPRICKAHGIDPHPARFPKALPESFIKLLTEPGDLVLDLFAGSNATGEAAESLGRRWLALECNRDYLIGSAFRFMADWPDDVVAAFVAAARTDDNSPHMILSAQKALF
jgi:DNA modification methylase